jgi:hypothetical protein
VREYEAQPDTFDLTVSARGPNDENWGADADRCIGSRF